MKTYLYGGVIIGLMLFAWWFGDSKYDEGYAKAESKYLAEQQKAIAAAVDDRTAIHKADKEIILQTLSKAKARELLLKNSLKRSESTINELRKTNICNLSLGVVRMFNDITLQYQGLPAREPIADGGAGKLTVVTGDAFGKRGVELVKKYYDLADQLTALQAEVKERD